MSTGRWFRMTCRDATATVALPFPPEADERLGVTVNGVVEVGWVTTSARLELAEPLTSGDSVRVDYGWIGP